MIDYLKLGRNLHRFAPRVQAKSRTFIYNSRGIYDFKQMNPNIEEALNNSFRGVDKPVLELSVKNSRKRVGKITLKDGIEKISEDDFVLNKDTNLEEFLPKTDGCWEKLEYDSNGINDISEQNSILGKLIPKFIQGLKEPNLELILGKKHNFAICKIVLKDGNKIVSNGYYSKSEKSKTLGEKIHFWNKDKLITGFGDIRNSFCKPFERLNEELRKRLWILDDRAKKMIKTRYGIECSPKSPDTIAKMWNLTGARIRGIINDSKKEMTEANTFCTELNADLNDLGHILSDNERYNLYHRGSSVDINKAEEKIINYKRNLTK